MTRRKQKFSLLVIGALCAGVVFAAAGIASPPSTPMLTEVLTANPRSDGYAPASKLSAELKQVVVAQGSTSSRTPRRSRPSTATTTTSSTPPARPRCSPRRRRPRPRRRKPSPTRTPTSSSIRASTGPSPATTTARISSSKGHEGGAGGAGYITRINLDADHEHRVTLLATSDVEGHPLTTIDGSTWEPWSKRLLFTTENPAAPTYAATPNFPSAVVDVSGALGRGGYEGIQDDSDGNIWIVEDVGGSTKPGTTAKRPNSFLYRYVPAKPGDLRHGKLEALQVLNGADEPITFASQAALNSPDQLELHTYGKTFTTKWVTIHDTAVNGSDAVPRERSRQGRERDPVQASRERPLPAGLGLQVVLLRRDRRHQRDQRRRTPPRVAGARS